MNTSATHRLGFVPQPNLRITDLFRHRAVEPGTVDHPSIAFNLASRSIPSGLLISGVLSAIAPE